MRYCSPILILDKNKIVFEVTRTLHEIYALEVETLKQKRL